MSHKSVQTGPVLVTVVPAACYFSEQAWVLVAGIDSHYQHTTNTSTYFLAYMVNPFLKPSDLLFSNAPLVAVMDQNLVWLPLNHIKLVCSTDNWPNPMTVNSLCRSHHWNNTKTAFIRQYSFYSCACKPTDKARKSSFLPFGCCRVVSSQVHKDGNLNTVVAPMVFTVGSAGACWQKLSSIVFV